MTMERLSQPLTVWYTGDRSPIKIKLADVVFTYKRINPVQFRRRVEGSLSVEIDLSEKHNSTLALGIF